MNQTDTSERDKRYYAKRVADPEKYAKILEQNRQSRKRNNGKRLEYDRTRDPAKLKARQLVRDAIARGLPRGECVVCQSPKTHGHHEDYNKPREVVWLCDAHHADVHQGRVIVSLSAIAVIPDRRKAARVRQS